MQEVTVSQLNMYVKMLLETDGNLSDITVSGEISNFTNHYRSGHLYLTLGDRSAVIKAVMFKTAARQLDFTPENGTAVVCRGRVSLYDRDGQYQLYINSMKKSGAGDLAEQFRRLCEKLRSEGLFDEARKRPVPEYPARIAVITSPTGAAVRDIIDVLGRRYRTAEILLCPVQVQGQSAPLQLIKALRDVGDRRLADVIIIGRGGGAAEELSAFNDEELARTVSACPVPVISAVGHETDFTLCDFVADLRAPTPSAAAELAVPDSADVLRRIENQRCRALDLICGKAAFYKLDLDRLTSRRCLKTPEYIIENAAARLRSLSGNLSAVFSEMLSAQGNRLVNNASALEAMSPLKVLTRGYSILIDKNSGFTIKSVRELEASTRIRAMLGDGEAEFTAEDIVLLRSNSAEKDGQLNGNEL